MAPFPLFEDDNPTRRQLEKIAEGLTIHGWCALLDREDFDQFDLTEMWHTREFAVQHGFEHLRFIAEDRGQDAPDAYWVGRVCVGSPLTGSSGSTRFLPVFVDELVHVVVKNDAPEIDAGSRT